MKRINILLALSVFAAACSKDINQNDVPQNPENAESLNEITINKAFNWSASTKLSLDLSIKSPATLKTDDSFIEFYLEDGTLLGQFPVQNGSLAVNLSIPHTDQKIYAFYPATADFTEVTQGGNIALTIPEEDIDGLSMADTDLPEFVKIALNKKSVTYGPNLVINGNFDDPNISQTDSRTTSALRNEGDWYRRLGTVSIQNVNGSNALTSGNGTNAQLLQAVQVEPKYKYTMKADANGNTSFRVYLFDETKSLLGYIIPPKNNGQYNYTYTLPASVNYMQVFAQVGSNSNLDNISIAKLIEPDSDNDGLIDRLDDYPNDPNKAIANFYPLQGRQTLAFEDLWPAQGDFDFNDMVLSNIVEYGADLNGNLVDAVFKVRVEAMGAGLPSGIGIKLYKPDGSPLSQNVISSISGQGRLDPDVTNGIIVFDNVRDGFPNYFTNTTANSTGDPIEFSFTITFNQHMTDIYAFPDIFIFRSDDRGREVHLPGTPATEAADPSYFNTGADYQGTYRTKNGLPFAIELLAPMNNFFSYPLEKVDICQAYPYFQQWAESGGNRYTGWMVLGDPNKTFN